MPQKIGVYLTGSLIKSITYDHKKKRTLTYTDFNGRTVLKKVQLAEMGAGLEENGYMGWLSTYYVYDDFGQLRSIVTPKAVKYLIGQNWIWPNGIVYNSLCFYYHYDEKGRVIVKHSPAAGELHYIYDTKDRLIFTQDQKQRAANNWNFMMYDEFNRVVLSGIGSSSMNREQLQNQCLNNGIVTSVNAYLGSLISFKVDNSLPLNLLTNIVYNKAHFYDNYNYATVKNFDNNYQFAATNDPYVLSTSKTNRVNGFETGTITRVIDKNHDDGNPNNDKFLNVTGYFDEKGKPIQTLSDNIKNGVNVSTIQYNFSGVVLSTHSISNIPSGNYVKIATTNQYEYNSRRQLISFSKDINNTGFKKISSLEYDAYGRIKQKILSPDYNNGYGLETLKYDYNIRGWLTGINKDYALQSNSALGQWSNYFGLYLGYDNKDNAFASKQLNGNLTGVLWKTQGDNMPRKYDYEYDNAGRFIKANFNEKESPTSTNWNSVKMNFTVDNITYDDNSNLLSMWQKGKIIGNANPVYIDKLAYKYKQVGGAEWSNQLESVFDASTEVNVTENGTNGDFKDKTYGVNDSDYQYDENGNMTIDNNKDITTTTGGAGIIYNYMDKPQKIIIKNKTEIEFTYNADGTKLGKSVKNIQTGIVKQTWYIGAMIFEETSNVIDLKIIQHEEGRIRVYKPQNNPRVTIGGNFNITNVDKGAYEYFLKDHLQNIRMILTEESHSEYHNCTMENVPNVSQQVVNYETQNFGQINTNTGLPAANNEVNASRTPKSVTGWNLGGVTNQSVAKLSKLSQQVGPNFFLKVMAGDAISTKVDYFYNTPNSNGLGNILNVLVPSIINALSTNAMAGSLKNSTTLIDNSLNANVDFASFINNQNQLVGTTPQAYLNVLFFDENFNFIPNNNATGLGSISKRVTAAGQGQFLDLMNIKVPKNGYAYIYISNNSNNSVYFDNLEVNHNRGQMVEENHYYPFGLKIKTLGGRAFDKGQNKFGYQGAYAEEEEETEWNEFDLRMYNPQIGLWNGVDPMDEFASPYIGMGSNPVNLVDPSGGNVFGTIASIISKPTPESWSWLRKLVKRVSTAGLAFDAASELGSKSTTNYIDRIGGLLTLPENAIVSQEGGRVVRFILDGSTYKSKEDKGYFEGYYNVSGEQYRGNLEDLGFFWQVDYYREGHQIVKSVAIGDPKDKTGVWNEDPLATRLLKASGNLGIASALERLGANYLISQSIATSITLGDFDNLLVETAATGQYVETREWYGRTAINLLTKEEKAISYGVSSNPILVTVGNLYTNYRIKYKGKVIGTFKKLDKVSNYLDANELKPPGN